MRLRLLILPLLLLTLACTSSDDPAVSKARYTNAVAVADLNGDGKADLLTVNGLYTNGYADPGYASLALQGAGGALGTPVRLTVGGDPAAVALGDLNGDGRVDFVVANAATATVTVFLQSATTAGTFTQAATLQTAGLAPLDVAIGDLNQDGKPDLAVATSGSQAVMAYFQGATASSYPTALTLALGGDPRAVAIADLNGDGRPDLAVSTTDDVVSVLFQNAAAGTFAAALDLPTGPRPVALKVADLNGDGRLDLVTANYRAGGSDGLSLILQGTTPGTFNSTVDLDPGDTYAAGLALADVTGDGRPDLVVACAGNPGYPGSVTVLRQDPAAPGTFLAPDTYGGYTGPVAVAVGDLDGDGLPDLVAGDGKPYLRPQLTGQPGKFGPGTFLPY